MAVVSGCVTNLDRLALDVDLSLNLQVDELDCFVNLREANVCLGLSDCSFGPTAPTAPAAPADLRSS